MKSRVILLFLSLLAIPLSLAGDWLYIYDSSTPVKVSPGDSFVVSIQVKNPDTSSIVRKLKVVPELPYFFKADENEKIVYLEGSAIGIVKFIITVDPSTPPGKYILFFKLLDDSGEEIEREYLAVEVIPRGEDIIISIFPTKLILGEINEVTITVKSSVSLSDVCVLVGGALGVDRRCFSTIEPSSPVRIDVLVTPLSAPVYTININITSKEVSRSYTATFYVVEKKKIFEVKDISNITLDRIGKWKNISILVYSDEDSAILCMASDWPLIVQPSCVELSKGYNKLNLKALLASRTFKRYLPIRFNFIGSSANITQTIYLENKPIPKINIVLMGLKYSKASIGVINTGDAPAKNVLVKVGSVYSFYDEIDTGDYVTVYGYINSPKIHVVVTYEDDWGNKYIFEKDIDVSEQYEYLSYLKIKEKRKTGIITAAILSILCAYIFRKIKRRR